jgi:hypothetical protein
MRFLYGVLFIIFLLISLLQFSTAESFRMVERCADDPRLHISFSDVYRINVRETSCGKLALGE